MSLGPRGMKVNVGHGRVKTTVGIPGTGLSWSKSRSLSGARPTPVQLPEGDLPASHPWPAIEGSDAVSQLPTTPPSRRGGLGAVVILGVLGVVAYLAISHIPPVLRPVARAVEVPPVPWMAVPAEPCSLQVSMPSRPQVQSQVFKVVKPPVTWTAYTSGDSGGALFRIECTDLRPLRKKAGADALALSAVREQLKKPSPTHTFLNEHDESVAGEPASAFSTREDLDGKRIIAEWRALIHEHQLIVITAWVPEADPGAAQLTTRFVSSANWVTSAPVSLGQVSPAASPAVPSSAAPQYQFPAAMSGEETVFVQGHFRKNGTYVQPHLRRPTR